MKTILVTGIGGLTPRSITTIIRENHPDYKIIGCDLEKKAVGFFMKGLLDVYLINGGMSLQFNVFNADMLRDAQKNPDKYKNLQVRVCGWNVLWNNLSRAEQDAYITRAENIVG